MEPVQRLPDASLSSLFDARRLWRGHTHTTHAGGISTGLAALDEVLPQGGWPPAALSEILLPANGVGELQLVLPALARLATKQHPVVLAAPPYLPGVAGWSACGVDMRHVLIVQAASPIEALWALEQCLRSAACSAVIGWPQQVDDRALRRLQVAADTGQTPAFVFRDRRHAEHASPAALRIELETRPTLQLRVRKCRGAQPPTHPVPLLRRGA